MDKYFKPDDKCTKHNIPVIEVHDPPTVREVGGVLKPYNGPRPGDVPVVVRAKVVELVTLFLLGVVGPGWTDVEVLKNLLLSYGQQSEGLQKELAVLTKWLANLNSLCVVRRDMLLTWY